MGLKQFTIDFAKITKEASNRFDVNFIDFYRKPKQKSYPFKDLFTIEVFTKKDRMKLLDNLEDDFYYCEIGNCSKEGEVEPQTLNFEKRNELTEDYFKKIEKGDIQKIQAGNILVSKVRPNLKKYIYVTDEYHEYYYTTAFLNLHPRKMNKVLYYALRTIFYGDLMAIARQGKGYPTLKENDLFTLRFDKRMIDKLEKNEKSITDKIESIETIVQSLKTTLKPTYSVINQVFAREFNFNIDRVSEVACVGEYNIAGDFVYRNHNLRMSVRWNKIESIQKELYKNCKCIQKLGRLNLKTKNGWSPSCRESDTKYSVFGVNSLSKDTSMTFEDLKTTDETRSNIDDYFVKEGDLFISRGNTVDLVALASIVRNLPEDQEIIFPDLFIRIDVDEELVLKEYLAYLFNSIIGRLYFKYVTKGKNQTMVKVSADELSNFYIPVPTIRRQKLIIQEIKKEFDRQEKIKNKIDIERQKIKEIIFQSIN
ncbi:MAG: restriction endonuclease subunit S [Melioribacteraceae bacterium]|nr:restriction endonuclease subunit S [Melioribacteraceae bacterium]